MLKFTREVLGFLILLLIGAGYLNSQTAIRKSYPSSGTGSGYSTVENEGTPLTQRSTVNFTGTAVDCIDSGGKTVCDVTATGGSGLTHPEVMSRLSMGF